MEYYIYVTNNCNMNCSYCSVMMKQNEVSIPANISYSLDKLKSFIHQTQIARLPFDKNAIIYFFGGEPTLDYNQIAQIIKKLSEENEYGITYILHTNGLLLNKIPKTVVEKIDVIFLSLNYEKIFVDGHITAYFSKIIDSITTIKRDYGITTIGRLTISQNTSLYSEATLLGLFFDYIYWQLDNQKEIEKMEQYKTQYIHEVSLLFKYWMDFLEHGIVLKYIPFLAITRHALFDKEDPINFYCGYGDDIVYIQTDGTCYGCCDEIEGQQHYVGNIRDGIRFHDTHITADCKKCQYLRLCGGRCGRMHNDFSHERIQHFCDMNIALFNKIIESQDKIERLIEQYPYLLSAINDPNIEYTEQIP